MTRELLAVQFINSLLRSPGVLSNTDKAADDFMLDLVRLAYLLADAVIARRSPCSTEHSLAHLQA